MRLHSIDLLAAILATVCLPGCTYVNRPLNSQNLPVTSGRTNHTLAALISPESSSDSSKTLPAGRDHWFVGLAISGGGSRSANFAAATMFELQRIGLLNRVDAVSAVSGGSLAAAYYCLTDDQDWNPGNVQKRLGFPFASEALGTLLQPWTLATVWLTDYDRSDILAASFNRHVFSRGGKTLRYADLRPDRPRLLINATDLQSGRRFVFCNESFDGINSDLSRFPVAYAVAASSAVPVVLHQVTLRDFSTSFHQYRHFIDGGVVDNLGVQTLLETYQQSNDSAAKARRPLPFPKGAVLLVVDAGTQFNAQLSDKGDVGLIESLGTGAKLSTAKLLQRASSATLADLIVQYAPADLTAQEIRELIVKLEQTGFLQTKDRDGRPMTIVHIALSRAAGLKQPPFQNFAQSLDAIETYFNITETDAHYLYKAAELIVHERFAEQLEQIRHAIDR